MEINIRSDSKKQLTLLMLYIRKNTITADVDHVTDSASQELPVAQKNGINVIIVTSDTDWLAGLN